MGDLALDYPHVSDFSFVDGIIDGSLSARKMIEIIVGVEDWDIYQKEALEDMLLLEKISSDFKENFPEMPTLPPYYECMNCHRMSKRAEFLQEQEELDEDGIPKVRLQCPDCGHYDIRKEKVAVPQEKA